LQPQRGDHENSGGITKTVVVNKNNKKTKQIATDFEHVTLEIIVALVSGMDL